jgi:integrase
MAAATGKSVRALRDQIVLLLGFAGAFRRSELVALDFSDLEFCDGGLSTGSTPALPSSESTASKATRQAFGEIVRRAQGTNRALANRKVTAKLGRDG